MAAYTRAHNISEIAVGASLVTLPIGGFGFGLTAKWVGARFAFGRLGQIAAGSVAASTVHTVSTDLTTAAITRDPRLLEQYLEATAYERIALGSVFWAVGGVFGEAARAVKASGPKCFRLTWKTTGSHAGIEVRPVGAGKVYHGDYGFDVEPITGPAKTPLLVPGEGRVGLGPLPRRIPGWTQQGEQLITRQQATRILQELRALKANPGNYSYPGIGLGSNCVTSLTGVLNRAGAGSYGVLGPYSPASVGLAPALGQLAPTASPLPAALGSFLSAPRDDSPNDAPRLIIDAKETP